jgi:hypothetical protein
MLLETLAGRLQKARSVNQTSAAFVSKVPTLTEPVGDAGTATGSAVIDMVKDSGLSQNLVKVKPYGVGANNTTFSVRVIGWSAVANGGNVIPNEWIPELLGEFACTISSSCPGVSGGVVAATEFFVDTITQTYPASATSSIEVVSNAADLVAHAVLDVKGNEKIELSFSTGSSATSCNALISRY